MSAAIGTGALAAVLKFAFPGFTQYRGGVFLEFAFEPTTIDRWLDHLGDVAAVERVVNHVHLWDVLAPTESLEVESPLLAAPLAAAWEAALCRAFPSRAFKVVATEEGDYGPEIFFCAESHPEGSGG